MKLNKIVIIIAIISILILSIGSFAIYNVLITSSNGDENGSDSDDPEFDIPTEFEDLPKGIDEEGIDTQELLDNHTDIIKDESATINHSINSDIREYKVDSNYVHISHTDLINEEQVDIEEYGNINEETRIIKQKFDQTTEYESSTSNITDDEFAQRSIISAVLNNTTVNRMTQTEEGYTELTFEFDERNSSEISNAFDIEEVNNLESNMKIRNDGLIKNIYINITGEDINQIPTSKSHLIETKNIGDTTVNEPEWFDTASSQTSAMITSIESDTGWIVSINENYAEIPEGSTIELEPEGDNKTEINVTEDISNDDVLYIWMDENNEWNTIINDGPEESNTNFSTYYDIKIYNNDTVYYDERIYR